MDIITIPKAKVCPDLLEALKKEYEQEIHPVEDGDNVHFFSCLIRDWRREKFILDLQMYAAKGVPSPSAKFPDIAAKNACCRFTNYNAHTPQRKRLVNLAKSLASVVKENDSKGLYVSGGSLEERTHITLAMFKDLMERKITSPYLVDAQHMENLAILEKIVAGLCDKSKFLAVFEPNITTDRQRKSMLHMIENAFSYGRKLFIASAERYESFKNNLTTGLPTSAIKKYDDRMRVMFDDVDLEDSSKIDAPPIVINPLETYGCSDMTNPLLNALQRTFNTVLFSQHKDGKIDYRCSPEEQEKIETDIEFFQRNPAIPNENICSQFWNYHPKNKSQQRLLEEAKMLIGEVTEDSGQLGLFVQGPPGVGKTHISIATAKAAMKYTLLPIYIPSIDNMSPQEFERLANINLHKCDLYIFDDYNAPSEYGNRLLSFCRDIRKRVLITSNVPFDEFIKNIGGDILGGQKDFLRALFKVVKVTGESYRGSSTAAG